MSINAFVDNHPAQSFFVDRRCTPRQLLATFAKMRAVRARLGDPALTAEKLYRDHGYGVAAITVAELRQLGFVPERDDSGNEFNIKGHVNVKGVRDRPDLLADASRVCPSPRSWVPDATPSHQLSHFP